MSLKDKINKKKNIEETGYQPIFFDLKKKNHQTEFESLIDKKKIKLIDDYSDQVEELQQIKKPSSIFQPPAKKQKTSHQDGLWVYYPWKNTAIHILEEKDFYNVRVSRNQNLILKSEQQKFKNKKIGVAGLNVGNPGAICMALEGVGKTFKFADFDILSLTNLNRFRAGLCEFGANKAMLSARQALEVDPFLNMEVYEKGITSENVKDFLLKPKLDILVEETDNLKLKVEIRRLAKQHKIPVIMVTGNGSNVIIDVERYDLKKDIALMDGYLKSKVINKIDNTDPKDISIQEKIKLAQDFMGKEFLTKRLNQSFADLGKTLVGIPQLAESSFLRGGAICYFARLILLKANIPSGRYNLNIEGIKKLK